MGEGSALGKAASWAGSPPTASLLFVVDGTTLAVGYYTG